MIMYRNTIDTQSNKQVRIAERASYDDRKTYGTLETVLTTTPLKPAISMLNEVRGSRAVRSPCTPANDP